MSDHFPNPKKGRNRLIAVVIISALPMVLIGLGLWLGILMSLDDGAGVPEIIYVMAVAAAANLVIASWVIFKLFQQKRWARNAWIIICGLWGGVFMILLFSAASIGGNLIIIILFILALMYFGFALYVYRNYHVDAYFGNWDGELERKIGEIGEE